MILKESGTLVKSTCTGPKLSIPGVTFGKWIQTSSDTIQEFRIDGNQEAKIKQFPQGSALIYGNVSMQKTDPASLSLDPVANMFGEWRAIPPQSGKACSAISELSILNSGQIIRYLCEGAYKRWFEKGFFRIKDYRGTKIHLKATFNQTESTITLISKGPSKLIYDGVPLMR
ncbi:hypothetical protein L0F63_007228, partial [Massospora cicadina]